MRISDWSSDVCSSDLNSSDCSVDVLASRTARQPAAVQNSRIEPPAATRRQPRPRGRLRRRRGGDTLSTTDGPVTSTDTLTIARFSRPTTRLPTGRRSEEHTSELQSLLRTSYAVFCLKKKNTHNTII